MNATAYATRLRKVIVQQEDPYSGYEYQKLAVIPVGIALNLALGGLVAAFKLPIYLDAVGTIVVTMLTGWRVGMVVGVSSFVLASVLISPAYIYFVASQAAIALYVHFVGWTFRAFINLWRSIPAGIGLGIVACLVSAPVIIFELQGAAGSGRDFLTALLISAGARKSVAVLLSGFVSEPVDKTIQLLISLSLVRSFPRRVLIRFPHRVCVRN
jgi:energy-coupling factor transport system substrate-specific component